jgi:uncharacterized protein YprB with RNaseH-like and TPR domain
MLDTKSKNLSSRCRNRHHDECKDSSCACPHHAQDEQRLVDLFEETPDEIEARIERASHRKTQHIGRQLKFMRTCAWDLETTNLNANFGIILCSSIKAFGEDELTINRIDDDPDYEKHRWDDAYLCEHIRNELEKYQVIVVWNGIRFDLPMLESRLVKHRMRPIDKTNMVFVDLLWAARYRMRLSSNSLERVIEYLGTETQKTPLIGDLWIRAMAGDTKALDQIQIHNERDVESLEEVADHLSRFVKLQYKLIR